MFPVCYSQTVGLVLSGGGAKGIVHIGVLKALEESNIPIHFITGTSMGAVVGGLYASGYTVSEIEDILHSDQIKEWVTPGRNQRNTYYFKESDPNASWQVFKVVYDSVLRFRLPTNLVTPFRMDYAFMEKFAGPSAAAGYDFDSLFVGFRCVAADIYENKPIVLRSGDLGKAVRASTTFPFYFRPILIGDKLLFDGGMYDNFPVKPMLEDFRPDILIGSKAASNYGPPRHDDVISQVLSMLMGKTEYDMEAENGFLIEHETGSTSLMDFSGSGMLVQRGYDAAMQIVPDILKRFDHLPAPDDISSRREEFRGRIPTISINSLEISGLKREQQLYINKQLASLMAVPEGDGNQLLHNLELGYFKLSSEECIDYMLPRLEYIKEDSAYKLILDIKPESSLTSEIGGLLSSRSFNQVFLKLGYIHWRKRALKFTANTYLGRFYNSGQWTGRIDYPGRIPVFMELLYTYNSWNFFKTSTYFFEDVKPSYLLQTDHFWRFQTGAPLTLKGKTCFTLSSGRKRDNYYQTNNFSRTDTADITTFDFISPGYFFEFNTMNRRQYASSGLMFHVGFSYIVGKEKNIPGSTALNRDEFSAYHNWFRIRFLYDSYFAVFGPVSLGLYTEAILSSQELFNNYTSSVLAAPAFQPFPESGALFLSQFRAYNFAAIGLRNVIRVARNTDLRIEGYGFQPFSQISRREDNTAEFGKIFSNRYFAASTNMVYHLPFGPLSIGVHWYDQPEEPFSFNLNLGYFIFNKRPFE